MPDWNPSEPDVLGLEWLPTQGFNQPVGSTSAFVQRIPSTTAQTIGALRLPVGSNPAVTDPLFVLVDIIPGGSEVPGSATVVDYAPNGQQTIGNWTDNGGGTTNIWQAIDDAVVYPPPSPLDWIKTQGAISNAFFEFATATFPLTARVIDFAIRAVIGATGGTQDFDLRLHHVPSGTTWTPPNSHFVAGIFGMLVDIGVGEINPVTAVPWTPTDIRAFDTGDWLVRITAAGSVSNEAVCHSMGLRLTYVTENRSAVATWRRPAGPVAGIIQTANLVTMPGGTANWSKPGSGTFAFLARGARAYLLDGAVPQANDIVWLSSQQDLGVGGNPPGTSLPPIPGMEARTLPIDFLGRPTQSFAAAPVTHAIAGIVLRTTAPADSTDSQPYVVHLGSEVIKTLSAASAVGQRMTATATQSYLGVRAVVKPPDSDDGTLTLKVHRVSDDVQMGGTFTITADQVRALPAIAGGFGLRYIQGLLSSAAALTNAVQYELRMTVDAGTWNAVLPYASGAPSPTFGGSTDIARVAGVSLTDNDALLTLLEQPAAPTNVTAAVIPNPLPSDRGMCTPDTIDQVTVSWTSPALGVTFDRYEIERLIAGGDWEPVWEVNSAETKTSFTDRESPRNRNVKYRVRVVATTAAFSAWVETGWVLPESRAAELIFTSNHSPGLEVVYDYEPGTAIEFLDHAADVLVPLYGSDMQVAFMEPEDRGLSETFRVIVHADNAPCDDSGSPLADNDVFEPLRALSRSGDIPYVAVVDSRGNVTYGHLTLSRGEKVYDAGGDLAFYWVTVRVTPVAATPTVGTS